MNGLPKKSVVRLGLAGGEIDLHYRVLGQGPVLLMLHPSPLSSAFMVPFMQRFANRVTAVAPDTPGFGRSTRIPGEVRDLAPFVEAMRALCDALGLQRYAVYGSATGAQIAIELAKADAGRVTGVILDNAAVFTNAECERIMDGYFPDVTPREDGGHLGKVWQVAHDSTLFFPWHHRKAHNRIASVPAPAEAMNMTALGYLQAGPGYEQAYRAAFRNERAERVADIDVPVSIIRWQSSILKPFADRFDDYAWGDNLRMAHCDEGMEARLGCIEAHFPRVLGERENVDLSLGCSNAETRYVETSFGQVRWRVRGDAPKRIALHAPGASIDSLDVAPFAEDMVTFDLPGHGESDCPDVRDSAAYLRACDESLKRVAAAAGIGEVMVEGLLAKRLLACGGRRCGAISGAGDERIAPPEVASESAGEHLWRGWYWLRDRCLRQGQTIPHATQLTQMLLDLLRSQAAHRHAHRLLQGEP